MTDELAMAIIGCVAEIDRAATSRDVRSVRRALYRLSRLVLEAWDEGRR